jgi:ubiquinone/menaquinone biosynthesis C-methylase UbiE
MEKQSITTGFQQVDNSQHEFLVKFIEDMALTPVVKESLELQMSLLGIKPGDHLLDVGCGIGVQAQEMAKRVAPTGKVVGTDISTTMIDLAKSKTSTSNLPLEFFIAEASSQPFPDQSFDGIRTERVLLYIPDSQKVLKEFKRLLKPGGKLVIFEFYWDGALIPHPDKELTRKIIHYVADSFPNNQIGTNLYYQLRSSGFHEVEVKPYAYYGNNEVVLNIVKRAYEGILQLGVSAEVFTQSEINNWWKVLDEEMEAGNFFISFQGLIGSGTNG